MGPAFTGTAPDPGLAADLAEFITALGGLRMARGAPSYRTLAKRVGPHMRPPQTVSPSTVTDAFKPTRRRLDVELVIAIVRALGLGEDEVARWSASCIRVHVQAKAGGPGGVFRQLPPDLATFTGRAEVLEKMISAAVRAAGRAPSAVVLAIEGMAGVGKTQLAVHAAHKLVRSGRFGDIQLYVNLRGFDPERPPADPASVLDAFLRQLEVPAQHIPADPDERAAMFRDRIHGKDALILLDNAAGEEQVRPLIQAAVGCLVLVTSRRNLGGLDGAVTYPLDVYPVAEAVRLLAAIAGRDRIAADPPAAEQVAKSCGCLPLALALAAARLRSRPAWSVADLAERLEAGGFEAVSTGGRSLHAVFDLSWGGLGVPAQSLFPLLSLHPGDDLSAEAAAALAGVDAGVARALLEELQDHHLVQQKSPGRYSLHDLLRRYAATLAVEHCDPDPPTARLLSFYVRTADNADLCLSPAALGPGEPDSPAWPPLEFTDRDHALRWFEAEYRNLLAVQRFAATGGYHLVAAELPMLLNAYFTRRANTVEWIAAVQLGVQSAAAVDNPRLLGSVLNKLGMALTEGGRQEAAADALERAIEIGSSIDARHLVDVASANLAVVEERRGRLHEALQLLTKALAGHRSRGSVASEGVALENIGKINLLMGDFDEAIEHCEQAMSCYEQSDREYEEINALNIIGQVHRASHRLAEAERSHRDALARSRALAARRSTGHSLHQLGLTLRDKGDRAEAAALLREAVDVYTEVDDPRTDDAAAALEAITESHR